MKRLLPLLCLAAAACGNGREGAIVFTDPAWNASVVAQSENGFSAPDGIVPTPAGILMADEGDGTIRLWNGKGKVLLDKKAGILTPEDIVVDPTGTIYFTDDDAGGLWRLAAGGKAQKLAPELKSTEALARAPDGTLLVGDGKAHAIFAVSPEGPVTPFLSGIAKPESLAFDDQGNLYIADNQENVLYLRTQEGRLLRLIDGGFSPESIAWTDGALFVTDSADGKLFRFTPAKGLETVALFSSRLGHVSGVAGDGKGGLYLTVQDSFHPGHGYLLKLERPARR
jgi:sugar lactone lactonase YvrE